MSSVLEQFGVSLMGVVPLSLTVAALFSFLSKRSSPTSVKEVQKRD